MAKPAKPDNESFSAKDTQARFEAALKGGMNTSPKPLKEKPKVRKRAKRKAGK